MKIENCRYVLHVCNNSYNRSFRMGFQTYQASHRNLTKYKNYGFHGELVDKVNGFVVETF